MKRLITLLFTPKVDANDPQTKCVPINFWQPRGRTLVRKLNKFDIDGILTNGQLWGKKYSSKNK